MLGLLPLSEFAGYLFEAGRAKPDRTILQYENMYYNSFFRRLVCHRECKKTNIFATAIV